MKNLLPALLLLAVISCRKMADYSYEGSRTPPRDTTQVSVNSSSPSDSDVLNQPNSLDSGVLNDLNVPVAWFYYDEDNKIAGSVSQGPHALGNVGQLFAYAHFNMISTDTVSHCYVEWYRSYPVQKPSDLLLRKAVELNQPIPFIPKPYVLSDVKLIRITQ